MEGSQPFLTLVVPQLVEDLSGSLKRLLISSSCDFWCTGRILVQVEQRSVLIIDGESRWLFAKMIFLKNVSLYGMLNILLKINDLYSR